MLKLFYDTKADIPTGFDSLYTERDGKWHLTQVEGIKTQADVDRQLQANQAERSAHTQTKAQLAAFTALGKTAEDLKTLVEEEPQLRAKADANGGAPFPHHLSCFGAPGPRRQEPG